MLYEKCAELVKISKQGNLRRSHATRLKSMNKIPLLDKSIQCQTATFRIIYGHC